MKQGIKIIGGVLLAAALSSPAWAKHGQGGGGGGESMAGGLPALEDRVDALAGQNNWAGVSGAGVVVRSSSVPGPVTVAHTAITRIYESNSNTDLTGYAYE